MKFERISNNPIIRISDVTPSAEGMEIIGVFNCGVAKYEGKTLLLLQFMVRGLLPAL